MAGTIAAGLASRPERGSRTIEEIADLAVSLAAEVAQRIEAHERGEDPADQTPDPDADNDSPADDADADTDLEPEAL